MADVPAWSANCRRSARQRSIPSAAGTGPKTMMEPRNPAANAARLPVAGALGGQHRALEIARCLLEAVLVDVAEVQQHRGQPLVVAERLELVEDAAWPRVQRDAIGLARRAVHRHAQRHDAGRAPRSAGRRSRTRAPARRPRLRRSPRRSPTPSSALASSTRTGARSSSGISASARSRSRTDAGSSRSMARRPAARRLVDARAASSAVAASVCAELAPEQRRRARGGGRAAHRRPATGRRARVQPVGEALVEIGAQLLGHALVGAVADELVAEAERVLARAHGADEVLADERVQVDVDRVARAVAHQRLAAARGRTPCPRSTRPR